MQRMAANMGGGNMPYMPPGAAEQMKNMKPEDFARASEELGQMAVSYTHLTLPTIYSV